MLNQINGLNHVKKKTGVFFVTLILVHFDVWRSLSKQGSRLERK